MNTIEQAYSILEEKLNLITECVTREADNLRYTPFLNKLKSLPDWQELHDIVIKDFRINSRFKSKEELIYYHKNLQTYLTHIDNLIAFASDYSYLDSLDNKNDDLSKMINLTLDECILFWKNVNEVYVSLGMQANAPIVDYRKKLVWKGQKNQLYSVLRQLKNDHELIGNSYNSLADFLIQNVTGFENTSKETIEKELKKRNPLPKGKRINVTPEKEE